MEACETRWRRARQCGGVVTVFIGPNLVSLREGGGRAPIDSDDHAPIESDSLGSVADRLGSNTDGPGSGVDRLG